MPLENILSDSFDVASQEFRYRVCGCNACRLNGLNSRQADSSHAIYAAGDSSLPLDLTGVLTDEYYSMGYRDYFGSIERIGYYVHDEVSLVDWPSDTYSWSQWDGHETIIDKAFGDIDPYIDLDFYKVARASEAQIHIYRVSPYPGIADNTLGFAFGSHLGSLIPSAGSEGRFQTVVWTDFWALKEILFLLMKEDMTMELLGGRTRIRSFTKSVMHLKALIRSSVARTILLEEIIIVRPQ